jgi:hypothetical protein
MQRHVYRNRDMGCIRRRVTFIINTFIVMIIILLFSSLYTNCEARYSVFRLP